MSQNLLKQKFFRYVKIQNSPHTKDKHTTHSVIWRKYMKYIMITQNLKTNSLLKFQQ